MKTTSNKPMPVRFSEDEDSTLRDLKQKTGLGLAELIRRAVRFAGPKFLSGEVNVATLEHGTIKEKTV